jgi:hypothetical protein
MKCLIFLSWILSFPFLGFASDSLGLIRSVPMKARFMTVDETGNVYVVRENNALVRFTPTGDSSAFFRSVQNGEIGSVDANNPMRIVVYYPGYSKVVLLDRQLARKNELDLRRLNLFNSTVVASSADGHLWVYDQFNARLKKINEQLEVISQSNDIRVEASKVPSPSFMVERDWKVFLCDTAKGIFTFDRYGNYVNTVSLLGVNSLQVFGSQLVYSRGDTLYSWDLNRIRARSFALPKRGKILQVALVRNTLYMLFDDRLELIRFPDAPWSG